MKRPDTLLVRDHLEWLIEAATERTHGNITEAARLLGVDRTTLSHWVNRGLSRKYYAKEQPSPDPVPALPEIEEPWHTWQFPPE